MKIFNLISHLNKYIHLEKLYLSINLKLEQTNKFVTNLLNYLNIIINKICIINGVRSGKKKDNYI